MLILALTSLTTTVLIGLLSVLGDPVTEPPWGLGGPISFYTGTVNYLITVMPWLEVMLQVLLLGITVRVSLFIFNLVTKLFSLIRG